MSATQYFVYMVRCADSTFYIGYTTDVSARVAAHNGSANKPGARYTRSRRPVTLVYEERCEDRAAALQREHALKQLTRTQKQQLITKGCSTPMRKPV